MLIFKIFKTKMSSFSHFSITLNQNKLIGPNYVDWKRNLDIGLTAKVLQVCTNSSLSQ
jgi:hypothetical protein